MRNLDNQAKKYEPFALKSELVSLSKILVYKDNITTQLTEN
jgi:hypothetical protein